MSTKHPLPSKKLRLTSVEDASTPITVTGVDSGTSATYPVSSARLEALQDDFATRMKEARERVGDFNPALGWIDDPQWDAPESPPPAGHVFKWADGSYHLEPEAHWATPTEEDYQYFLEQLR